MARAWQGAGWGELASRGVWVALAVVAMGCARSPTPVTPVAPASRACVPRETQLRVVSFDGLAHRAYVQVDHDGATGLFLLDTGAARSHFRHDLAIDRVLPARGVRVGCDERWLESRASRPLPPWSGVSVIGTLGADALALSRGVAEIDLARGRVRTMTALPAEVRDWPSAPLTMSGGVPLTEASIDGARVRLLLDTGTEQTTLVVPAGDDLGVGKIVRTSDAFGNPIALTEVVASVAWGDDLPARSSVYRTSHFPAFEELANDAGGANGILGLASFGLRRVVLDVAGGRVWLEPTGR